MRSFIMLCCAMLLSSTAFAFQDSPFQSAALEMSNWQLQEINGTPAINEDVKISFNAKQKMVQGKGGCNNFGGAYWSHLDKIKIVEALSTQKTCKEYDVMQIEDQFFVAMAYVEQYSIFGDTLAFYNKNGNVIAIFKAAQ